MNISFIDINPDENVGSYRIWVKDLSRTLSEIGHNTQVFSKLENIKDLSKDHPDAIILGKSCYTHASQIRKIFPKSKIGTINISADYKDENIDFVIVGSPEEYISMSKYKNVFIYPLIERKFENVDSKSHSASDITKFCFHGHWPHIPKFAPYITKAIERYHDEVMRAELHIITGEDSSPYGKNFIPEHVPTFFYNYKNIDFTKTINKFDIGLVPNITCIENISKEVTDFKNANLGLYETDYSIRFKNKTNGGRAYVFYQHGIPVIHDISPSSFDFMGRADTYVCGHDTDSYLREMIKLSDHTTRNKIAKINNYVFKRDFNPVNHGKNLIEFIKEV